MLLCHCSWCHFNQEDLYQSHQRVIQSHNPAHNRNSHGSRQLQWIKKWGDFFAKSQTRTQAPHAAQQDSPFLAHLNALNLEISKTARKEQNYNLSYRYLFKVINRQLIS